MASWDDLSKPRRAQPQPDEFSKLCATVFAGGHGQKLLQMLRNMTIEHTLPDGASESALRSLEGKRQLVRQIENATERGREQMKASKAEQ